jgi:hypothetical protein
MYSFGVLYSFWPLDAKQPVAEKATDAESQPRSVELNTDLHINYWEIDDTIVGGGQFLDFGLMVRKVASDVNAVYFYFPFSIEDNNVEDLGGKLKNEEMISALFNEDYDCDSNTGTSYTTVHKKGSRDAEFYLYELGKTNWTIDNIADYGSILKISFLSKPPISAPANPETNIYIRFRLKNIPISEMFYEEEISNDYIQSAFYKTKMLDFRVNERREMNNKLLEVLETKERHFVQFIKFHFYYIGSTKKEKIEGFVNYNDCRLLDYSTWEKYLPSITNRDKRFLCYHWKSYKQETPFPSCSIFMRTIFKSLNGKIVAIYSAIAIGLSFMASAIWGVLSNFIFPNN